MITIIKHGTIKKKRCEDCGCVFTFENEDVLINDDPCNRYHFITCPQCKKHITYFGGNQE